MRTIQLISKNIKLLILFCTLLSVNSYAQDIHFSQFHQVPLLVNPSLAGVFSGDFRSFVNYKEQWNSIAPYNTYGIGLDGGLFKKNKDKYLGAGLFIYQDVAGDSRLSTTEINLSLSSVITINKSHIISAGLQGGIAQKKMDMAGLRWGTQYDAGGYAPEKSSKEAGAYENHTYGDFSMGISWSHGKSTANMSSNNHFKAKAGVALYHINTPKQGINLDKLHMEFIAHAGLNVGLKGTSLSLLPSLLYLQQGPLNEISSGAMIRHTIREESKYTGLMKEIAVQIGVYYRVGDAVIPTCMFEIANYSLGISYDMNVSSLKEATNGAGGMELSFRYLTPNPFKSGKGTKYTPML